MAAETRIEPAQAIASNAMRSVNESIKQMPEFAAVLSKPPEYLPHQQTLLASIRSGLTMLKVCSADLNVATQLPPLGDDPASLAWKQQTIDVNASNIVAIIASLLAAAGSLINHATGIPDEMEFDLLTANVTSMTANVAQMGQGIKLLAALSNDGDGLLDAAHSLVESIVRLFDPLQSIAIGELERKNEFYTSGQELSVAAHGLLVKMDRLEVGEDAQHDLLALAYNVSKAVTDLVAGARNISKSLTDNHALQQDIVGDARYLFDTCQQLVACISTVAPTLNNQACADQVMEGSVYLRDAIGMLTSSCENSSDEELRDSLLDAASRVEESIAKLVEKTAQAGFVSVQEGTEIDLLHDLVLAAVERMIASANDVEAIIGNTKDLTLSASQFVTFLKQNASSIEDGDEKSRAISNAKNLADATSKMVACAKDAAKNPGDSEKQERLRSAVEEVQRTANVAAGSHVRNRVLFKLAQAVKDAIASSNQLISAAKAAAPSNRHQSSQLQLNQAARKVNEILPQLTAAVQAYQKNPDDLICRVKLVNLSKQMVLPGFAFVSISKLSSPTIGDSICQSQLLNTARQSEEDIRALERSQKIAEQINSELQVDSALRSIKNIQKDLMAAQEIGFDTNSETSPLELFSVASSIQQTISQLASAAAQQNERNTDFAATDAVMALQALSMAAQGFAAVESDIDFKQQILGAASGVADTLSSLISAAKTVASGSSTHEANETNLKSLVEGAAHALDTIVEFLPGQKDLEVAINSVEKTLSVLPSMKVKAVAASDPKEAEAKLMESAAKVTAAAHAVVQATRGTLSDLQTSLSAFTTAFETVTEASVIFDTTSSIKSNDVHSTSSILKELGESSAVLLNAAKAGFAEKDNQKIRQQLAESTRKFTKTTTKIIDVCSSASPQQIQINRALRTISEVGTRINEVAETGAQSGPVSEISASALRLQQVDNYGDCVQEIATNSKSIMNALVAINNLAKSGKTEEMAEKVNEVALTVSELTEANSRAAYLVGVANLNSTPATRDTVDRVTLIKGAEVIKSSCNALINIENDHNQILEIAASIAKTTSDICNACKVAGQTASILPQHRQTFIASAKETAARTTALVSTIKELATQTTEEAKEQCAVEVSKLINCVDGLVQFSDSPEFVGNAAVISAEGLDAQKPLIDYNKELLAAVENVTMAAKQLVSEPQDENFFGQLSSSIRSVTDSVQKLAKTVSSSTPGVKECEEVVAKVSEAVLVVDQAMVESSLNALEPKADASATAVVKSFQALSSLIEVTYQVTKNEPTQVVLSLQELPENFDQVKKGRKDR